MHVPSRIWLVSSWTGMPVRRNKAPGWKTTWKLRKSLPLYCRVTKVRCPMSVMGGLHLLVAGAPFGGKSVTEKKVQNRFRLGWVGLGGYLGRLVEPEMNNAVPAERMRGFFLPGNGDFNHRVPKIIAFIWTGVTHGCPCMSPFYRSGWL
jgi:hypothetical protein